MRSTKFSRFCALFLVVALVITGVLWPIPARANNNVMGPAIPIVTRQMADNVQVLRNFIRVEGGANAATSFLPHGNSYNTNSSTIAEYDREHKHKENGRGWYLAGYWPAVSLHPILAAQDLKVKIYSDLKADKHTNIRHLTSITDRAYLSLYADNSKLVQVQNASDDKDEAWLSKESSYVTLKQGSTPNALWLSAGSMDCECGSSAVRRASMVVVDEVAPKVVSMAIYGRGNTSQNSKNWKAGDTGQVRLRFSEPIRFANGEPPTSFVLNLSLVNEQGRELQQTLKAGFFTLSGSYLYFNFTVPEAIGGANVDCYIAGLAKEQPSLFQQSPLKIYQGYYYKNANYDYVVGQQLLDPGFVDWQATELRGIANSSSVITDIAGNSMEGLTSAVTELTSRIRLDRQAPEIARVEFVDALGSPLEQGGELNRRDVYHGVGREVHLLAIFSEVVTGEGRATATLNVLNAAGGTPITLQGDLGWDATTGVSQIRFDALEITAAMVMDGSGSQGQIKITQLAFPASYKDVAGNGPVSPATQVVSPTQTMYLDNIAPTVTGLEISATPGAAGFYLKYKNTDTGLTKNSGLAEVKEGKGAELLSGFAWVGEGGANYPFQYALTASSTPPTTGYREASYSLVGDAPTFWYIPQLEIEGNHLHLRLIDPEHTDIHSSKIIIRTTDWAGNTTEKELLLEDYVSDAYGPEISVDEAAAFLIYSGSKANLHVPVQVTDPAGFDSVAYQWCVDGVLQDPVPVAAGSSGSSATFTAVSPELTNAAALRLCVMAEDARGNEASDNSFTYHFKPLELRANVAELPDPYAFEVGGRLKIGSPVNLEDEASQYYEAPVTTLVVLKNPFASPYNTSDAYFFRPISSEEERPNYSDLFDGLETSYEDWYVANVDLPNGLFSGVRKLSDLSGAMNESSSQPTSAVEKFLAISGLYGGDKPGWHYYGELEITLLTGFGELPSIEHIAARYLASLDDSSLVAEQVDLNSGAMNELLCHGAGGSAVPLYFTVAEDEGVRLFFDSRGFNRTRSHTDSLNYDYNKTPRFSFSGEFLHEQNITLRNADLKAAPLSVEFLVEQQSDPTYYGGMVVGIHRPVELWPTQVFAAVLPDINAETAPAHNRSFDPKGEPWVYSTLAGAGISYRLKDGYVPEWLFEQIDFSSPNTYFKLYYTEHQWDGQGEYANRVKQYNLSLAGQLVYSGKPLSTKGAQSVVIPASGLEKAGYYALELSYAFKDSDYRAQAYYTDLFMDTWQAEAPGAWFIATLPDGTGVEMNLSNSPTIALDEGQGLVWGLQINRAYRVPGEGIYHPAIYNTDSSDGGKLIGTSRDIDLNGLLWLKIYNPGVPALGGAAADAAPWVVLPVDAYNWLMEFVPVQQGSSFAYPGLLDGKILVPIVVGAENHLVYQMATPTGAEHASTHYLSFRVEEPSTGPSFDLLVENPQELGWASDFNVSLINISAPHGIKAVVDHNGNQWDADRLSGSFNIWGNGSYTFTLIDNLGQICQRHLTVDWIDRAAPLFQGANIDTDAGTPHLYRVNLTLDDATPAYLLLRFTGEYAKLLPSYQESGAPSGDTFVEFEYPPDLPRDDDSGGGSPTEIVPPHGLLRIPLAEEPDEAAWREMRAHGVYGFTVAPGVAPETHEIALLLTTQPFAAGDEPSRLMIYAEDSAGNIGDISMPFDEWLKLYPDAAFPFGNVVVPIAPHQVTPQVTKAEYLDRQLVLDFNTPVKLLNLPNGTGGPAFQVRNVGLYENSNVNLLLEDVFGRQHELIYDLQVPAYADFPFSVQYSTWEATQDDVTLVVQTRAPVFIESLVAGTTTVTGGSGVTEGRITAGENGDVVIRLVNGSDAAEFVVTIDNIDRQLEAASLQWQYRYGQAEDGSAVPVTATASVVCEEPIYPIDLAAPLEHTFTTSDSIGSSHTFSYRDAAGNEGSIKATLDVALVAGVPVEDQDAPETSVTVYYQTFNSFKEHHSYGGDDRSIPAIGAGFTDKLPTAQAFSFAFRSEDASRVKLIIRKPAPGGGAPNTPAYADTSDTVSGVTLLGNTVQVDAPAEFYVFAVDEAGNYAAPYHITVTAADLDREVPAASVEYVPTGLYALRGYLVFDADVEPLVITNALGVAYDAARQQYYHDFTTNEVFTFTYRDEIGNVGRVESRATGVDVDPPEVVGLIWSPAGIKGPAGFDGPPTTPTNKPVTAQITFKNPVAQVEAFSWTGTEWSPIAASHTENTVTVQFADNGRIKLKAGARNGQILEYELPEVLAIDKVAPVVSVLSRTVAGNKRSVKVTLTVDKDAYSLYDGVLHLKNSSFAYELTEQEKTLRFTDRAGNGVELVLTAPEIDRNPLTAQFSAVADGSGATADLSTLQFGQGDTLYVKFSHAVTLVHRGTSSGANSVAANTWAALTFGALSGQDTRLGYRVVATDGRGDTLTLVPNVKLPDTTPPVLTVPQGVQKFPLNSQLTDIESELRAKITVMDNEDPAPVLVLALDAVRPGLSGHYTVTVTATDASGNVTTRFVSVEIESGSPLFLRWEGESISPNNTLVTQERRVAFTLIDRDGVEITEPYTVFWRAGLKTIGQMKVGAEALPQGKAVTFPGSGYYTLYIRCQSRIDYLIKVYVLN